MRYYKDYNSDVEQLTYQRVFFELSNCYDKIILGRRPKCQIQSFPICIQGWCNDSTKWMGLESPNVGNTIHELVDEYPMYVGKQIINSDEIIP